MMDVCEYHLDTDCTFACNSAEMFIADQSNLMLEYYCTVLYSNHAIP